MAHLALTRDISARKRAEEHQKLLIKELNHRVKNTLVSVQSITVQTLRTAVTEGSAKETLEGRSSAALAHDLGAPLRSASSQRVSAAPSMHP